MDQNENKCISSRYILDQLFCSATANLVGLALGHPFETIKVRLHLSSIPMTDQLRKLLKNEGFNGLYKGFSLPLLTYIPYYTCCFTFTNMFQKVIHFQDRPVL